MELFKLQEGEKIEDKLDHVCTHCGEFADVICQYVPPNHPGATLHYPLCVHCQWSEEIVASVELQLHKKYFAEKGATI